MRQKPSRTAEMLVRRGLVKGRVLDFGCGHGFDADTFGWESYDPYYRPIKPVGPFDTIVCIHVLSALTRNNRSRVTSRIRELLAIGGMAYLAVPRDIPVSGKLGIHHNLQNHVALTLPSIFADKKLEIYAMHKTADFEDKTRDYISRRDRCRDR